jgi:hypothetical protein
MPKTADTREPAMPGGAGAKPPLDPLIEVLKEMYPPHGDVPDVPPRTEGMSLQLDAGIGGFELPVGQRPAMRCEDLLVGNAAIHKLPSFSMTGATRSDAQILGQIERGRPEFEDTFSEDSVNRARKQTRETALAASKK